MSINLFIEDQYLTTRKTGMAILEDYMLPIIDFLPYFELLYKSGIVLKHAFKKRMVECVYRNWESAYNHIQLPTGAELV